MLLFGASSERHAVHAFGVLKRTALRHTFFLGIKTNDPCATKEFVEFLENCPLNKGFCSAKRIRPLQETILASASPKIKYSKHVRGHDLFGQCLWIKQLHFQTVDKNVLVVSR